VRNTRGRQNRTQQGNVHALADDQTPDTTQSNCSEVNTFNLNSSIPILNSTSCLPNLCTTELLSSSSNTNYPSPITLNYPSGDGYHDNPRSRLSPNPLYQALGINNTSTTQLNLTNDKIEVQPFINGKQMSFELDTGSAISVMNFKDFKSLFTGQSERLRLRPTSLVLKTYSGELIKPLGFLWIYVSMTKGDRGKCVRLYVVDKGANPLFGRSWLRALFGNRFLKPFNLESEHYSPLCKPTGSAIPQSPVGMLTTDAKDKVNVLINQYTDLFDGSLGKLKGVKGKLYVHKDVKPTFCKARSVPFTLEQPVSKEIDRLVKIDAAYFVPWSEWATPAVPVF